MARFFDKFKADIEQEKEDQTLKNSQGISQEEYDSMSYESGFGFNNIDNVVVTNIDFGQVFEQKVGRISKYREMAIYPEISKALDAITDEAIVDDQNGDVLTLDLKKKVHPNIEKKIRIIWDNIVNNVFEFNEGGWDLFRKYIIEGELYIELILNDKKNAIINFKVLPCFTMTPIYKGSEILGFRQKLMRNKLGVSSSEDITFTSNQVVYVNFGIRGESLIDQRGYLESSIRIYNQLKNLEDALIVYRLVRAPERRVWNIATGKMPKGKAEEYIKGQINRYKRKSVYDPATGMVDSAQNIQALTEDFWFAVPDGTNGTTVNTLSSGLQLGEITDVNYFLKKLYLSLKVPKSRFDDNSASLGYDPGRVGSITRDEISFTRMIQKMQRRFKYVILDTFILALKMAEIDEEYIDKKLYNIKFTESNLFKLYKEIDIQQNQLSLLSQAMGYVKTQNNPDGVFAKKFAFRRFYQMSEEDYDENEKLLEEQDKEQEDNQQNQFGNQDQFGGNNFGADQSNDQSMDQSGEEESPLQKMKRLSGDSESNPEQQEEDKEIKKKPKSKLILSNNHKIKNIIEYIDKK